MQACECAISNFFAGNYERAIEWARQAIAEGVNYGEVHWVVVASYGPRKQKNASARIEEFKPTKYTSSEWLNLFNGGVPQFREVLEDGLRKARQLKG